MKMTSRVCSCTIRVAALAVALAALAQSPLTQSAQAQNVSFAAGPVFTGVPNNAAGNVVIYNLPLPGSNHPVTGLALPNVPTHVGPVTGHFDLFAQVQAPGTQMVTAYGVIMTIASDGSVKFNVPPDDGSSSSNLPAPMAHAPNGGLTEISADMDVPGFNPPQYPDDTTLGVTAIYPGLNADTAVANNDGLAAIPVQVGAAVTGSFAMSFHVDDLFTGFINNAGTRLTNASQFPHVGTTIVARNSRPGDMNGDSILNAQDIPGFIAALNSLSSFQASRPYLRAMYITDFRPDQVINAQDIPGFIQALNSPSPPAPSPAAIPEPSSIGLILAGAACSLAAYCIRRRRSMREAM